MKLEEESEREESEVTCCASADEDSEIRPRGRERICDDEFQILFW